MLEKTGRKFKKIKKALARELDLSWLLRERKQLGFNRWLEELMEREIRISGLKIFFEEWNSSKLRSGTPEGFFRQYLRQYQFKMGLAVFLLLAVLFGTWWGSLKRQVAERPGGVLAAYEVVSCNPDAYSVTDAERDTTAGTIRASGSSEWGDSCDSGWVPGNFASCSGSNNLTVTASVVSGNLRVNGTYDVYSCNATWSDTTPPVRSGGAPSGTLPIGTTQTNISLATDENAVCKYSTTAGQQFNTTSNLFWKQETAAAPWSGRHSHAAVNYNNRIWLMGGTTGNIVYTNDVWSFDGTNWTSAGNAPWSARINFASDVYNNRIWVLGGWDGARKNDVWSFDGTNWTSAGNAPWSVRSGMSAVAFNGKLWLLGGYNGSWLNEVWSYDGTSWTSGPVMPAGRSDMVTAVYKGKLWVIGGMNSISQNNVWSFDGTSWTVETPFGGINSAHPAVVLNGRIWLMGTAGYTNSSWSFDGTSWIQQANSAPWTTRQKFPAVVYSNKIWILGGNDPGFRNDIWTTGSTLHSRLITGLINGGSYNYYVRCEDAVGNVNPDDYTISFLVAGGFDYSLTNSGNVSVVRGGSVANTITATLISGSTETVTFSATGPAGTTYSFSPPTRQPTAGGRTSTLTITTSAATPAGVSVITARGTSSPSSVVRTTTFNLTVTDNPPTVPINLSATAASSSQINLSWNASSDTDATGLAGYKIFRNGVQVGTSITTTYADTGLAPLTTYNYTVSAYDTDTPPRESAQSSPASATTLDGPPTAPAGLTGTVISSRRVSLSWGASSDPDATPLVGYRIFRNGSMATTVGLVTSYLDTTVAPSTSYNYTVRAFDSVGTVSTDSNAFAAVTFDPLAANVRGWAWNQGTGWVSFNADYVNPIAITDTGARLVKENQTDSTFVRLVKRAGGFIISKIKRLDRLARRAANFLVLADKFGFKLALAQADIDFGVNIATTTDANIFQFSGFAWSEAVGWIYFGPDNDFTAQGYGNVQVADAPGAPLHWAQYDRTKLTDNVTGWAKILSMGPDGWVKMSDSGAVGTWAGNGINLVASGTDLVFTGWAWSGGSTGASGLGWLALNSATCDTEGGEPNGFLDTACGGDNTTTPLGQQYRVVATGVTPVNQPPTVATSTMTAPNWSFAQASSQGARNAILRWTFTDPDKTCVGGTNDGNPCASDANCPGGSCLDNQQGAYQVIINTSNSMSSPVVDTGKQTSASPQYQTNTLAWGTKYYWWLRVWDNKDATSTWVQYNSPTDTPAEADDGDPLTFSTYKHEFPIARFEWLPQRPSRDEDVSFFDRSQVYLIGSPTTPVEATSTPSPNASWLWTFNNGAPATSNEQNPVAKFSSTGNTAITLKVTDPDGYYSSTSTTINANLRLPKWQERKPD